MTRKTTTEAQRKSIGMQKQKCFILKSLRASVVKFF
jgi:hypothetical protein